MQAMADTSIDQLTAYCKATADQQRLLILRALSKESFGVLELCHILNAAQPALSHHLKVLHNAGLVETRRQGNSIYYRRAVTSDDDPLKMLKLGLLQSVDEVTLSPCQQTAMTTVHDTRHRQAKEFFEKNANRFKENQNLIAEYQHYESCITDLLDSAMIQAAHPVIEVGAGDSQLIIELTHRFGPVAAIDNNADMLEKTRQLLTGQGLAAAEYFHGELHEYEHKTDLVVINMVLHHLASPARFFQSAHNALLTNGSLLIADLTPHDQDWAGDACGDLWQGFEPEELDRWAESTGFTSGQSAYLGLRNGFQVQVRLFHKS